MVRPSHALTHTHTHTSKKSKIISFPHERRQNQTDLPTVFDGLGVCVRLCASEQEKHALLPAGLWTWSCLIWYCYGRGSVGAVASFETHGPSDEKEELEAGSWPHTVTAERGGQLLWFCFQMNDSHVIPTVPLVAWPTIPCIHIPFQHFHNKPTLNVI